MDHIINITSKKGFLTAISKIQSIFNGSHSLHGVTTHGHLEIQEIRVFRIDAMPEHCYSVLSGGEEL
jgi:hypothetical protein